MFHVIQFALAAVGQEPDESDQFRAAWQPRLSLEFVAEGTRVAETSPNSGDDGDAHLVATQRRRPPPRVDE